MAHQLEYAGPYEYDQEFSESPGHSVVEMSDRRLGGLGPGELRIQPPNSYGQQHLDSHFPESPRSSRLGSFMGNDPKFESPGASSASEELVDAQQQKPLVTVVWRNLEIVIKHWWSATPKVLLKKLSGYAEPRSILAVVGPTDSGKSVLLAALAKRLYRPSRVAGEILVNGMQLRSSSIEPTYLAADDELLWGLTVEQTLTYTGELQLQGSGRAGWRETAHTVSESLGLLSDMHKTAYDLPLGTRRRVAVACQLINASPLLILHDVLDGIQEGDALAIMRCLQDFCREGCTAILGVQQPTTDICSFFNKAYVLCNSELVYFGNTSNEALTLLSSSGMPCPPLYSPVEQYMRLIDPSFEVYLQVSQGQLTDTNARFSSMMFKVLQDSFENSQLGQEQQARTDSLAKAAYDAHLQTSWVAHNSSMRHFPILCRRIIAQALRCMSIYMARIFMALILAIVYGTTYVNLSTSDSGWYQRTTIFFIVCAVVPLFSITCLPAYDNLTRVALREHSRCKVSIFTYLAAKVAVDIPHLVVEVVLLAIIFIPAVKLNTSGNGWGYFILVVFLNQMAADAMISAITAFFSDRMVQEFVALVLFGIQILAMGFFPGDERGFNLAAGAVSFPHYAYTGLVKNEAESHEDWQCPFANSLYQGIVPGGQCRLSSDQLYRVFRVNFGVTPHSKWVNAGIVAGIWLIWTLLFLAGLMYRIRFPRLERKPGRY